ncbi:MAG: T9SS type A sorting domain-containing protein, partial [Saprospiraceae bacterium]|nr:T9SS type A sorting domain-containing protein [Saprospiraceae bacterium]
FGVEEEEIKQILYDDFQYIPVIKSCAGTTSTTDYELGHIDTDCFPNPCKDWLTIEFSSENEHLKISVFDATGQELKVLSNQRFNAGDHQIKFDASQLPPGNYFYRLQGHLKLKTKGFIKV